MAWFSVGISLCFHVSFVYAYVLVGCWLSDHIRSEETTTLHLMMLKSRVFSYFVLVSLVSLFSFSSYVLFASSSHLAEEQINKSLWKQNKFPEETRSIRFIDFSIPAIKCSYHTVSHIWCDVWWSYYSIGMIVLVVTWSYVNEGVVGYMMCR